MGLIHCPDCGTQVSAQARLCIHCGRPLESKARHGATSTAVKAGHQRAQWRYEAGNCIGILGVVLSLVVMMMANLPLGIALCVGSAAFGLWLAYFS